MEPTSTPNFNFLSSIKKLKHQFPPAKKRKCTHSLERELIEEDAKELNDEIKRNPKNSHKLFKELYEIKKLMGITKN